ncbi:MAG: hypothetical protein QOI37_1396, partial [Chloroflexota bacterium]|nr:hypothetical protein [Chloroflexota bacterium]
LPFDVPRSLRFLIPDHLPQKRQTNAGRSRYLADLHAARPETRRAAAFDLGGWGPSERVDLVLGDLLGTEPDRYVRAVVALSLTLRGTIGSGPLVRCAEAVVADAELNGDERFASLAASVALLAAVIVTVRTSAGGACDECLALARRVAGLPGEDVRAEALSRVLAEQCVPPRDRV